MKIDLWDRMKRKEREKNRKTWTTNGTFATVHKEGKKTIIRLNVNNST